MAKCLNRYSTHGGEEKDDRSSGNPIACGRVDAFGGPRTVACDRAEPGGILCFEKVRNADTSIVSSGRTCLQRTAGCV